MVKVKTTRAGLNTKDVESFLIPCPPISVQEEIISKMGKFDDIYSRCLEFENLGIELLKSYIESALIGRGLVE